MPGAPAARGDTPRTPTQSSANGALLVSRADLLRAVTGDRVPEARSPRRSPRSQPTSRPARARPRPGWSPRALALLRSSRHCSGRGFFPPEVSSPSVALIK